MVPSVSRRRLIAASGIALFSTVSPLKAAQLLATPPQVKGPFYPLSLPLDRDNDLTSVAGNSGVAKGLITDIGGRVLDERGRAVPKVRVEIWQANAYGRYHHERDRQNKPIDPNFQGYGQFVTDADGGYRFRTIKPVAYPGRAPHIHFALTGEDFAPLITQMYIAGAPENKNDQLLNSIGDARLRESLIVKLTESADGSLRGTFDIVLAGNALRAS
ncbi:MAG TPA: protocatechuate 3,4-dioxygenase [Burkholderiales bacterium]|nr:protocatechuate 3,4-dioxygenase [Burkholderiales bacterium]